MNMVPTVYTRALLEKFYTSVLGGFTNTGFSYAEDCSVQQCRHCGCVIFLDEGLFPDNSETLCYKCEILYHELLALSERAI